MNLSNCIRKGFGPLSNGRVLRPQRNQVIASRSSQILGVASNSSSPFQYAGRCVRVHGVGVGSENCGTPRIGASYRTLRFRSSSSEKATSGGHITEDHARRLILYSKPGCCLCEGLKEKLAMVLTPRGDSPLSEVQLEVRDITTKAEWENAYQYEIPVLTRLTDDGIEEALPRFSPRLSSEQIEKKLVALLT